MLRVGGGALQLSQSPGVVGHVLGVLRVDGVDLALRGALREKRLRFQEEIKKNQIPFRKQRNPIDDSYPNRHFFILAAKVAFPTIPQDLNIGWQVMFILSFSWFKFHRSQSFRRGLHWRWDTF